MTISPHGTDSASNDPPKAGDHGRLGGAMAEADNVLGLIGNTPMVFPSEDAQVALKLEGHNPTGSVFDRAALYTTFGATDLHVEGTAALIASVAQLGAVLGTPTTYTCTDAAAGQVRSNFLELAEVLGASDCDDRAGHCEINMAGAIRALLTEIEADCKLLDPDRDWTIVVPPEATLVRAVSTLNVDGINAPIVIAPSGLASGTAQQDLARLGVLVDELSAVSYRWARTWAREHATTCVVVTISDGAMDETHTQATPVNEEVIEIAGGITPPAGLQEQPQLAPVGAARPLDLIGGTPLVRASHFRPKHGATITLKLEGMNATGSIKARAARRMVLEAMERGDLPAGRSLVEPSSGNLGLALAMVTASLGIECHLVCDPRMTAYSKRVMAAYGATVHTVDTPDDKGSWQGSRFARAREIEADLGALMLNQYGNPDNALAHAKETAPEVLMQLGDPPDVCVVGISTGGHMSGIGRAMRASGANTRMVGVDVEGSSIFGGSYEAYRLRGLGLSWWPGNLDPNVIDDVYRIPETFAFASARLLARREGIVSGGAAGAVVAVATAEAAKLDPTQRVLAIVAERGDRYLRNFYSREYRVENDLDLDLGFDEWTHYIAQLEPIERVWRDPDFSTSHAPRIAELGSLGLAHAWSTASGDLPVSERDVNPSAYYSDS